MKQWIDNRDRKDDNGTVVGAMLFIRDESRAYPVVTNGDIKDDVYAGGSAQQRQVVPPKKTVKRVTSELGWGVFVGLGEYVS